MSVLWAAKYFSLKHLIKTKENLKEGSFMRAKASRYQRNHHKPSRSPRSSSYSSSHFSEGYFLFKHSWTDCCLSRLVPMESTFSHNYINRRAPWIRIWLILRYSGRLLDQSIRTPNSMIPPSPAALWTYAPDSCICCYLFRSTEYRRKRC